jgi:hypothetical protein
VGVGRKFAAKGGGLGQGFHREFPTTAHALMRLQLRTTTTKGTIMKLSMRPLLATLVVSVGGLLMANGAQAGCGMAPPVFKSPALKPNVWQPSTPSAVGRFVLTSDEGGWPGEPAIVGMWSFQLAGVTGLPPGVPIGAVVDDGYAQWHSDGTEIQNSGVHAPNTSNFCLGVWKQVGPLTYQLKHFPLAWDPTANAGSGSPANAIELSETVHLIDGNHMAGTFTLKVYVWTSTGSLNAASPTPVATITGNVTATRVTVASNVPGT